MANRYSSYIAQLKRICRDKKFILETIGHTGENNDVPLFKVTLNQQSRSMKSVCFIGAVHGNETSGPVAPLTFLKRYLPKPGNPKITLIPVANPTGYAADTYRDFKRRNYNRLFGKNKTIDETRALLDAALVDKPHIFMSIHEDDVKSNCYLYGYNAASKSTELYRDILSAMEKHCPINHRPKIYKNKAQDGLILDPPSDGSFEDRIHQEKIPYSICLEIPDKISPKRRIDTILAAMTTIIDTAR
ncbi:MAG: M14 family zinc carboxypeptidase [Patescibacteria group bacterium]|nr:M14 family zinc carboxypeptidase [Patescibacteria group bacterium]